MTVDISTAAIRDATTFSRRTGIAPAYTSVYINLITGLAAAKRYASTGKTKSATATLLRLLRLRTFARSPSASALLISGNTTLLTVVRMITPSARATAPIEYTPYWAEPNRKTTSH